MTPVLDLEPHPISDEMGDCISWMTEGMRGMDVEGGCREDLGINPRTMDGA